jgi:hypothetical protein
MKKRFEKETAPQKSGTQKKIKKTAPKKNK